MGKKLFIGLMVACAGLAVIVLLPDAEGGRARLRYEQTLATAKLENKPVLLDFYTSWCPPCKAFDRARTTDPQVVEALKSVTLLQINAEVGSGMELARAYEVDRYPTFVLLSPNGDVHELWYGFLKSDLISAVQEGVAAMGLAPTAAEAVPN